MSIVDLSGKRCKSARATASPTTPHVPREQERKSFSICVVGPIERDETAYGHTSADDNVIHSGLG